jgi:hypothetical protein
MATSEFQTLDAVGYSRTDGSIAQPKLADAAELDALVARPAVEAAKLVQHASRPFTQLKVEQLPMAEPGQL